MVLKVPNGIYLQPPFTPTLTRTMEPSLETPEIRAIAHRSPGLRIEDKQIPTMFKRRLTVGLQVDPGGRARPQHLARLDLGPGRGGGRGHPQGVARAACLRRDALLLEGVGEGSQAGVDGELYAAVGLDGRHLRPRAALALHGDKGLK